jgi:hypothetical protein
MWGSQLDSSDRGLWWDLRFSRRILSRCCRSPRLWRRVDLQVDADVLKNCRLHLQRLKWQRREYGNCIQFPCSIPLTDPIPSSLAIQVLYKPSTSLRWHFSTWGWRQRFSETSASTCKSTRRQNQILLQEHGRGICPMAVLRVYGNITSYSIEATESLNPVFKADAATLQSIS